MHSQRSESALRNELIDGLQQTHAQARMSGWDFSALAGRLRADEPWWDFEQDCFAALQASEIGALDLGTGGGERLSGLLDRFSHGTQLPPTVLATEGWKPNVPIARTRLAPYGVQVIEYDSEIKQHLDLPEGRLDLVMSRHESFDPGELSRVLVPGGSFLTQQVDGFDAPQLHRWFAAPFTYPEVTAKNYATLLTESGFRIEHHAQTLWELHQHEPIEVTQRRFRIYATRC
ncbi:class I SAM-dependent methyltransferase [Glutamicibacter uratoxydans]|uniref:class I SAM-dependent methyltransferase n=1 Tax=Glutamicibacter uratoxydans TaxID=43667 RepID=UPI003D6DE7F2